MKDFGKKILKHILIILFIYIAAFIIVASYNEKGFSVSPEYIQNTSTFFVAILGIGAYVLYILLRMMDGKGKKKKSGKDEVTDERGDKVNEFFNRDFKTDKELETEAGFNFNTLSTIRKCKKDGVLIRAEEDGHNMKINFVEPIHALIVGTTSSGKTYRFVIPTIQLMSMTEAKPSFVITDPKGELYNLNSIKLKNEGYDVLTINLRNAFESAYWNPLTYPFEMFQRSFNLEKEKIVHSAGDDPKKYKLILQREFNYMEQPWYEFNGRAYVDADVLNQDMEILQIRLRDNSLTALKDIATTVAPITDSKNPSWERTAQNFIQGVMLAMLEDSLNPVLGMTKEKYNLYNVYKICNFTDIGRDTYSTLREYLFQYRDRLSKVPELCSPAINNAESTTKNYMGFVSSGTILFSDTGISTLTSKSEIDFSKIDEKPTAIFLIIPDEIKTRHSLAILFITQLYKRLVDKANSLPKSRLNRNVYFLLDEFGNMPKFPEFGSIMTVGRSRGIFFELCVQSYSQLYQVYGQEEGKTIKDNCPIQVYVASEDMQTNKEFSELLGKKTIFLKSESKSKGADGKESVTTNEQVKSIPIAYPEQLMTYRDKGEIIIKTFSPNAALKTKITPAYKVKSYDLTPLRESYIQNHMFNESQVYYDIKNRNKVMRSQSGDDDDDDDDDLF